MLTTTTAVQVGHQDPQGPHDTGIAEEMVMIWGRDLVEIHEHKGFDCWGFILPSRTPLDAGTRCLTAVLVGDFRSRGLRPGVDEVGGLGARGGHWSHAGSPGPPGRPQRWISNGETWVCDPKSEH